MHKQMSARIKHTCTTLSRENSPHTADGEKFHKQLTVGVLALSISGERCEKDARSPKHRQWEDATSCAT